jgi:Zn-dependent peptidase ImmA (M78 family)
MPERHLTTAVRQAFDRGVGASADDLAAHLAVRFVVSEQAMRYRLTNLGIADPV